MKPTTWNRFCAWRRNIIHFILVDGLLRLIAPIFVPLALATRWIPKNPLWIFLQDDTNNRGVPQEQIKVKSKFLKQWNELGIRNHCANLSEWLKKRKQARGPVKDIWYEYCVRYEYKHVGNRLVQIEVDCEEASMLRPKFYNDQAKPNDVHNVGKYLSFTHSTWGRKKYFYTQGGRWYVLFSLSKIKRFEDGVYHIKELNIGASDRILIRNKPWMKAQ